MRKSKYPTRADTLGKRIRKRRMDLKLTLLEVAKASSITESYLSRIEADKQIPDMRVVLNIAIILKDDIALYLNSFLKKIIPINQNKVLLQHLKKSPTSPFTKSVKELLKNLQSQPKIPIKYQTTHDKNIAKNIKIPPEVLEQTPEDYKRELKEDPYAKKAQHYWSKRRPNPKHIKNYDQRVQPKI